ncbi:XRE family transcriptional regulator [Hymenobacter metallicola]|uniref:XRE family transcriptional regulator n=2 Tax=Hymenobacter metallicola TaxID=2563114 RepID=A0A4Z0PWV8_9BACT|nr:XRE family transcriptional regulator [Hymenobacter metallicola]
MTLTPYYRREATHHMKTQATTPTLGKNIKMLRTNMGLTQQQLADYLEVSREEVSYFENQTRKPSVAVLHKLTDLFGVDLADILSPDPSAQALNAAFAFRSVGELQAAQLQQIAAFRRIVSNYVKMDNLLSRED